MNVSSIRRARRVLSLLGIALFVVLIAFSLFVHLAPLTGHDLFIITGSSMEPSIPLGAIVIATPTDPMTIAAGDVVTIRADNGIFITHRVTGLVDGADGRFFELKGDANNTPDPALVPARAVLGSVGRHVPYAGYGQLFLSSNVGLVATAAIFAVLLLAFLLLDVLERATRAKPSHAAEPIGP